ncbi:MAG: hypothetical protein WD512_06450 [Candidatus Paceibacterota bacterium]
MEEFIDYIFLDIEQDKHETTPLKILTGKFKDVTICYGRVKIKEVSEDQAVLQFNYKFVAPLDKLEQQTLENDIEFKNYLGMLLNHIILESNEPNESREDYIEESGNERRILTKSPTVSKD